MVGLILNIIALIIFILAALNVPSSRVNLLAAGLAFMVAATVLGGLYK